MIFHDLNHPAYDPPDCPSWAKEFLPEFVQPFRGRNGLPAALRDQIGPLAPGVRGLDRYQANQFVVYRSETASYLYTEYTSEEFHYPQGLLGMYEKLATETTRDCQTDTEKASALLRKATWCVRHPSIPPCGPRPDPDRNLDDESLLESGVAWCNEQARIFVRLCQVSHIPARIIQLFYSDQRTGHCVAEFFADGRWCMADASWRCVFPDPKGELLSAAECHDGGEGQKYCGLAYYHKQQEILGLSDEELNLEILPNPDEWRNLLACETAESLAHKMAYFGIINYPLPFTRNGLALNSLHFSDDYRSPNSLS